MTPFEPTRKFRTVIAVLVPFALLGLAGWSWAAGGIAYDMTGGGLSATQRIERLKQFFDDLGAVAPLVYVLFVIVEVVIAPIPGLMLYAPGGILFGPFLGGLLALIGNVLGAGIACSVTRVLGNNWLTRFFEQDKLDVAQKEIESRGTLLIFLLRINPLTSSDIVSYAAGFTRISVWKVMFATGCGMAPLCFAQAWLAENLLASFPQLVYPLLVACVIYAAVVIIAVRRIVRTGKSIALDSRPG